MKYKPLHGTRVFFTTAPMPCPYLSGRVERRVMTELVGRDAAEFHDTLSLAGYRRSHGIAYAPACPGCQACVPVRIVATEFEPNRTQRRVWRRNASIEVWEMPPQATSEQYALFSAYQRSRHGDGDMAKMDQFDYQALVEDTPVDTILLEFRDADQRLVAACLTDHVRQGLSAVYSFYALETNLFSLGTFMILWLVQRARLLGLDHVYLGFWIEGCSKMSYKVNFQPLEAYTSEGWQRLTRE